ncbi:MAG TPA: thioredoxin domain-containing protein [Gemmatimonadales bacterium]|nr:thioredoxin domain-containing protein [Gemmatimonadales bacterium]
MRRFYLLLAVVAVAGGAALWYAASADAPPPGLAPGGPAPEPAADGFQGFTLGADTAPVEVVEYADFECPACAQFAVVQMPTIRAQLIETGKVRWRQRDFPLPSHPYARYAAHAAHCAGEQGKFWDMHDQLFFNHSWAQTGKDPSGLFRDLAERAGLDVRAYDECMRSGRHAGRIEASRVEGERRGVNATPTFFINGRRYTGAWSSDVFKRIVDSLLAAR